MLCDVVILKLCLRKKSLIIKLISFFINCVFCRDKCFVMYWDVNILLGRFN